MGVAHTIIHGTFNGLRTVRGGSINAGFLMGFSLISQPFWASPIAGNPLSSGALNEKKWKFEWENHL